jgi:D-glycero-D-manno-heptose 1,7-bisphosphate phosphatase
VINRAVVRGGKPYPPAGAAELDILPGVVEALARLRELGFLLIVVTNQPDVARGRQSRAAVEEMHGALRAALPLDEIRVCYHDDGDGCACRKPLPGLLTDAARDHSIDLPHSYMIGDRWRDIDAGHHAGCAAVLIGSGYDEREPERPPEARAASLLEASQWIARNAGD